MNSLLRQELQHQIGRLVSGDLSLHSFRDWHQGLLWSDALDEDRDAAALAWRVESLYDELTSNHINRARFFNDLSDLLPDIMIVDERLRVESVGASRAISLHSRVLQQGLWIIVQPGRFGVQSSDRRPSQVAGALLLEARV